MFSIAFLTGLVGSLHCVGMCGPLALALPVGRGSAGQALLKRLIYTLGRLLAYGLLGVAFGLLGERLFWAGLQQKLSVLSGVALLLVLFLARFSIFNGSAINQFFSKQTQFFFRQPTFLGFLGAGILNGFLPCGMVYVAIAGATATASLFDGAVFMLFFGLGTAPILLVVSWLFRTINHKTRHVLTRFIPAYKIALAAFLIVRGLNLGVPYLSPQVSPTHLGTVTVCHGK
jgi:uncharacterized protein